MNVTLRDFQSADADTIDRIALAAFEEYRSAYSNWPAFSKNIGAMSSLATTAEMIVAETDAGLAGAVAYVAPDRPKAAFFDPSWPRSRSIFGWASSCGVKPLRSTASRMEST
jgi:hypothetical protein